MNDIEADDGMVYKEEFLMEQEELKKVRIWCEKCVNVWIWCEQGVKIEDSVWMCVNRCVEMCE